jgi:hypothetical protein
MNNLPPTLPEMDIATVCSEHTRRVQLLTGQFWKGDIDLWHYRKQSRDFTQQLVNDLQALFNQSIG